MTYKVLHDLYPCPLFLPLSLHLHLAFLKYTKQLSSQGLTSAGAAIPLDIHKLWANSNGSFLRETFLTFTTVFLITLLCLSIPLLCVCLFIVFDPMVIIGYTYFYISPLDCDLHESRDFIFFLFTEAFPWPRTVAI